ncbi:hypothetical protein NQ314_020405, partial [Rhamnusium bicolor]
DVMSCPFRQSSTGPQNVTASVKRSFTSRQNSFQVLNDDLEDKNTLNLKHLNKAILILTAPPKKLGQELFVTSCTGRMERAFMCLGGDLKEFLTTLDGVHDVLKYQENVQEGVHESEAFICTASNDKNLQLDFMTDKASIAFLLVGILKAIAIILYYTEVNVTVTQNNEDVRHFRYQIERTSSTEYSIYSSNVQDIPINLQMGVVTFCKAFPWHFVIDLLAAEGLQLKGQMVYCQESDSILFIGSPFIDGLDSLTGSGLFISDIPLHDATRDVILLGEQARAQLMKNLRKNIQCIMFSGETIEAKTHEDVTMLFSDIVGFTSICSTATPMMVINMLQNLYNQFDIFCGQIDVYKVETIGDAYCVAGGLHKETRTHAQQIAWMALKMIETCSLHQTHQGQPIKFITNKNLQMRIGLHTGSVLAGVVGVKMPRYCMRLSGAGGFITEERDRTCLPKDFPVHIPGTCHFLNGYKHPQISEKEPLAKHIEAGLKIIGLKLDPYL